MYRDQTIAVILPALNEAESIGIVVKSLSKLINSDFTNIVDDIVVCDNASTDNTAQLAKTFGARVVYEIDRGYGAACLAAIAVLKCPDIVVFIDADRSVITTEITSLLDVIVDGNDLAIGSRTLGNVEAGSITPQQRIGNIIASGLIRYLWQHPITDLGPFRAIRGNRLRQLNMSNKRCGWTVEMQIKAIQHGLNVVEIPISSIKRIGRSKISGTAIGTFIASYDILSMIFHLWKQDKIKNTLVTPKRRKIHTSRIKK